MFSILFKNELFSNYNGIIQQILLSFEIIKVSFHQSFQWFELI